MTTGRLTAVAGGVVLLAGVALFWRTAQSDAAGGTGAAGGGAAGGTEAGAAVAGSGEAGRAGRLRSGASDRGKAVAGADMFREGVRLIESMPADVSREEAVRNLAQEWGYKEPEAAQRWAESLKDAGEREAALTHVALGMAMKDPRQAMEMVQARGLNQGLQTAVVAQWADRDFHEASAWVSGQPSGAGRDSMVAQLAQMQAREAPADAAEFLAQAKLSSAEVEEEVIIAVLHMWLQKDAAGAEEWVAGFPEGRLKERARREKAVVGE